MQPTVKRYYLLSRNSFDQSPFPFPSLFTCAVPKWPWSFPFFFFLLQILLPVLVKCSVKGVENRKKLRRHRTRHTCNSLSFSVEKLNNFGNRKWDFLKEITGLFFEVVHKLSMRRRSSGIVCGAFCCSWSRPISIGRLASIWVLLPCLLLPACSHAQLHLNSISSAFLLTRLIQNMRTLASCIYKLLMHKKSKESPNRNAFVVKTLHSSRPTIKVVNSLEIT